MDRSILPVIVGAVCTISGLVAGFCAYPLEMTHPVETLKLMGNVEMQHYEELMGKKGDQ